MSPMKKDNVEQLKEQALSELKGSPSSTELYDTKVKFLGKNGLVSELMKEMAKLPKEEKPEFGKWVNETKQAIERAYEEREAELKNKELGEKIAKEKLDLTLPGPAQPLGTLHPIWLTAYEIVDIMNRLGYAVKTGPQIEQDYFNFEALNLPKDHPARDMQDTFYIDPTHVLRTHTSPIQIHAMREEKAPLRVIGLGSVFRCDSDVSHSPNFHQIEGMFIDRKVSMSDLKGTIAYFVREFFGSDIKTRFRPSYFQFTEPSAEIDCSCIICRGKGCKMCKQSGWVEIGGSGLVHPKVLEAGGINSKDWQGFAFGFGLERMAIMKFGIEDIRLYYENDLRFLRQFRV
jgi:phenylalanyl-tRNA synthetase alpha chain